MGVNLGKSSGGSTGGGTTTVQLTPEQRETLAIQNEALKNTFMPAYKEAINTAGSAYNVASPAAIKTAQNAMDVAGRTGRVNEAVGTAGSLAGTAGLMSLFDPQYEEGQVNAALQAGRESARESQAGQNAMYGGGGGLGSARMALADRNLSSLNAQRQATAAANARAGVQANKANAATQLMTGGANALAGANTAAGARIGYSQVPLDVVSKYASILYGTPQGATTPNFAGTQGSTTTSNQTGSSNAKGFRI